ncbi:MAG: hypothetical protein AB7O39_13485 [Flavobacteriaceae bacterium]
MAAPPITKISDVFRTTGQPSVTYVERSSGSYERKLDGYLDERGLLCLVTGPSKTGKTTLYKRVLGAREQRPLVVQCRKDRTCLDIWAAALEGVDFERISESSKSVGASDQIESEASAKAGAGILFELAAKVGFKYSKQTHHTEIRQRVLADPSPDLLIPILSSTNYVLVIEDFHYLDDNEKILLFQQWKRFVDQEITVIVLGTTHRAVDIASSNKDLIGRVAQIDVEQWSNNDLRKICSSGMDYLKCSIDPQAVDRICMESVGLPIIAQQICLQLFSDVNIISVNDAKKRKKHFTKNDVVRSFHRVAVEKYSQFSSYYETLIRGPREKSRKYRTYELVLLSFSQDPAVFSLSRQDLEKRIHDMKLPPDQRPPTASINSTLGALGDFQKRRNIELLEWLPNEAKLYIVEPSFLFYVRWREERATEINEQLDLITIFFKDISDKRGGVNLKFKAGRVKATKVLFSNMVRKSPEGE